MTVVGWRGPSVRSVRPEPLAICDTQTLNLFHALVSKNPGSIQTPLLNFSTKYRISLITHLKSVLKSELKTRCNPITHKPNNPLYWDDGLRSVLIAEIVRKGVAYCGSGGYIPCQ